MPPRTRTARSTKALKENIGVLAKSNLKAADKVTKPPRKVLGDKTNSASDDNASIDIPNKTAKTPNADIKLTKLLQTNVVAVKSRRERRIPRRFVDYQTLKNKENAPFDNNAKDDTCIKKNDCPKTKTTNNDTLSSIMNNSATVSPFKTPQKLTEVSLVENRPRRVSRLPSRFEDHSISPSKFIPVQPCHASTPLAPKNSKVHNTVKTTKKNNEKNNLNGSNTINVEKAKIPSSKGKAVGKEFIEVTSDTNNNAKGRTLRSRKSVNTEEKVSTKSKKCPIKFNNSKKEKNLENELVSSQKEIRIVKKVVTPAKKLVSHLKEKSVLNKIVNPAKKTISKTKKSPVKLPTPVKHSYLHSVNKSTYKVETLNSHVKPSSPVKKPNLRTVKNDLSFKVLEENKKNKCNQDIYEFTFDPSEEPAPQKKKRKAVKRKPTKPKPKTVIFKNNYDQNVNKALAALKNAVSKKASQVNDIANKKPMNVEPNKIATSSNRVITDSEVSTAPQVQRNVASKIIIGNTKQTATNNMKNNPQIQHNIVLNANKGHTDVPSPAAAIPQPNQSIRVEDIAADFETSPQHDIDYSPVNSPSRPNTPVAQISRISDIHHHNDPLNLRENISFDLNPIASSSMNTSVRHPQPSPWRVEFASLPIRWHVNSYVKPNMTPAVECSFVNFDEKNKRKHVYTNLVGQHNGELPEIVQKDQPNLIQSSIISFIKEVVDKSSSKKKRGRSVTPVTASMFNDTADAAANKDDDKVKASTRQLFTPKKNNNKARSDTSNPDSSKDVSNEKENSKDSSRGLKRRNNEEVNGATPAKTPRKGKDDKYFGFDDSENLENVSPQKEIGRKKSLRQARAKAVLKEMNAHPAPTRAVMPVSVKTARMADIERLYDEMKSASDAPALSVKEPITAGANVEPIEELDEDTQTSVHLFEDVEDIVHHLKPHRKSYGKAKKVTFVMRNSSSDTQDSDLRPQPDLDEEDDLHDLSFDPGLPLLDEDKKKTKKKTKKRQKMTKKEEEEAEAWAAGFNSMCEDVDEFPLVVE